MVIGTAAVGVSCTNPHGKALSDYKMSEGTGHRFAGGDVSPIE
jgi:hypothetical protein